MGFNCRPLPENPCPYFESGGVQCELEAGHEDDLFSTPHFFHPHTIAHNLAGNGYSCWDKNGELFTDRNRNRYHVIGF